MDYRKKLKLSREAEYQLRTALAYNNSQGKFYVDHNDDVNEIHKFRGCFTKSLPHNNKGKPDKDEVLKMLMGIRKCKCHFNKIKYGGQLKLVNPSCVYSWDLIGPFKSSIEIEPTPLIGSGEAAAEMVELYEMALLRDLPFDQYENDSNVTQALQELNLLSDFTGPKEKGKVTVGTLFRGNTKGDLIGPYISQFLWLPFNYGICEVNQKYKSNPSNQNFMISWENALSVQNGIITESLGSSNDPRYIITLRDLTSFVHLDDSFQTTLFASLILNRHKCPTVIPVNSINETLSIDLGGPDLQGILGETIRVAMLSCWYHKWNTLKIRPEVLGMLVNQKHSSLHEDLLSSQVLNRTFEKIGSYLLSQAYPEGSPVHPSYPAGHATFIGAGTTILKAWYNEDFMIDAYQPNQDGSDLIPLEYKLRVGDELDKLASNVASGRNAAGVHYRSDMKGLELGEAIAIKMLEEHVHKYTYNVKFKFHKRNGELVEISNNIDKDKCV